MLNSVAIRDYSGSEIARSVAECKDACEIVLFYLTCDGFVGCWCSLWDKMICGKLIKEYKLLAVVGCLEWLNLSFFIYGLWCMPMKFAVENFGCYMHVASTCTNFMLDVSFDHLASFLTTLTMLLEFCFQAPVGFM